jgi:hypothetical protein
VVTRTSVSCELGALGLEVRVRYGSSIEGTTNPVATITRIKVYADGVLLEDSGPISDRIYVREVTFKGLSARLHTIQIHVETWGAPQPSDFIQFAQCPAVSDVPAA